MCYQVKCVSDDNLPTLIRSRRDNRLFTADVTLLILEQIFYQRGIAMFRCSHCSISDSFFNINNRYSLILRKEPCSL